MGKLAVGIVSLLLVLYDRRIGFAVGSKIESNADVNIVGGYNASEGQFPYQVSIRRRLDGLHCCGGSIITSKWILTAGHCVFNTPKSQWFIFAGSVLLSGYGVKIGLSNIIIHPSFIDTPEPNDIALLKLESELQFSPYIQPIKLETEDVGVVDCMVSGWGYLADGTIPNVLQYLPVRTFTTQQCLEYLGGHIAVHTEICAMRQAGQGLCKADSGGPLVAASKTQIGIVVRGSCGVGLPDIFTKVSAYIDWIQASIK